MSMVTAVMAADRGGMSSKRTQFVFCRSVGLFVRREFDIHGFSLPSNLSISTQHTRFNTSASKAVTPGSRNRNASQNGAQSALLPRGH